MSVYTLVTRAELSVHLAGYALGDLLDFAGITAGIENTNYFVRTSTGEYVLTLFEQMPAGELPFFLELMGFLAKRDIPCPRPLATRDGHVAQTLRARPATLVTRLPGAAVERPNGAQCHAIGAALASMHSVTREYTAARDDGRGAAWRRDTAERVRPRIALDDRVLLDREIDYQQCSPLRGLPGAIIHADLFRDNALFVDDKLTGIIDFYYACSGAFIYDLAITVGDWCYDAAGDFAPRVAHAIIEGYRSRRQVEDAEIAAWIAALRAAGLRFWLSRLADFHFPRDGEITHVKEPYAFKRVLLDCAQRPAVLRSIWD